MKKNEFGVFLLILQRRADLKRQHITVHIEFWQVFRSLYVYFYGTYEVNRNKQTKKRLSSQWQKLFAYFLCWHRVWETSINTLLEWTRFFDNFCGSYKILSVKTKGFLKTKPVEKLLFFRWKKVGPFFPRSIEHDKPQGTIYMGPKGPLTITLDLLRAFLWQLRGCSQKKFAKEANIPLKKIRPIFSRINEFDKLNRTTLEATKYSVNFCARYNIISSETNM